MNDNDPLEWLTINHNHSQSITINYNDPLDDSQSITINHNQLQWPPRMIDNESQSITMTP